MLTNGESRGDHFTLACSADVESSEITMAAVLTYILLCYSTNQMIVEIGDILTQIRELVGVRVNYVDHLCRIKLKGFSLVMWVKYNHYYFNLYLLVYVHKHLQYYRLII